MICFGFGPISHRQSPATAIKYSRYQGYDCDRYSYCDVNNVITWDVKENKPVWINLFQVKFPFLYKLRFSHVLGGIEGEND